MKRALRMLGRAALVLGVVLAAFVLALVLTALRTPLPAPLSEERQSTSVEIVDRGGALVREVRTSDLALSRPVKLEELAPSVVPALLAAEDARFFRHPGLDPFAMARAFFQAVVHRRIVSGASTLTQQLARTVWERPKTVRGKLQEMALALRIDATLPKRRILAEYLSRVEFGPGLRGIDAASRYYFDKPASALDLAEAATLVSIPRGPTLYDPRRSPVPVTRRRDRVLERMRSAGLAEDAAIERAHAETVSLHRRFASGGVEHLSLGLARGTIPTGLGAVGPLRRVETTLDAALEREVETLAKRAMADLEGVDATALAAIVVENRTGEVLAYVGSPDYFDEKAGGANDGVRALRQPGSTLKPFVYGAAMERLGLTPGTLLPDVELTLETPEGPYRPRNYDGRFHGPVRLRHALANSLNVPAVDTAEHVGPGTVLEFLHRAGIRSLDASPTHYGAALALGDGEVRLAELAEAYVALARGGEHVPLSVVRRAWTADGRLVSRSDATPERVFDPRTVALLTDVLSDDHARASSFGRDGELAFPFPVAAKTGTSKGYRDNWAVGFTREVTVAVWVGNFDGSPMTGSTGVTGAGPLFHDVLVAAMRGREPAPLVPRAGLVEVEVCSLSGALPGKGCTHRTHELFRAGTEPRARCEMHVTLRVDPKNGLLAGPGCPDAVERTFEVYEPRFSAWAASAGRPAAPTASSPRCPVSNVAGPLARVAAVRYPEPGQSFLLDGATRGHQEIVFAARPSPSGGPVRFVLDGRPLARVAAPYELPWVLVPGRHRLEVESDGTRGVPVLFEVADGR
ncbi:MAG TPA: penicillin-binding protein 1C [Polyangiaceae bacterium]|nr:penicillin-binding protein 1C [Polyangiaceae bacterium]